MRTTKRLAALGAAGTIALLGLSACGSSGSGSGGGNSGSSTQPAATGSIKGQTINVAIAYPEPKAMIAKFTAQTGVKVNWNYLQWDDLQTKIASAAEANSYFADVADVDWSKVGEYYKTKWFKPLNSYFSLSGVKAQYPQATSFIRNNTLMGMPMDGSMLVTTCQQEGLQGGRDHVDADDAGPVRVRPQDDRVKACGGQPARHPVRRGRGAVHLLVRAHRRVWRLGVERLLQAGVHLALLAGLQGAGVDGERVQVRSGPQGEPQHGGFPGVRDRPGA